MLSHGSAVAGLGAFHHHQPSVTSFLVDCSDRSFNGLTPDCRRLREMFNGKEVLGAPIECDPPAIQPSVRFPHKLPPMRNVYIHDTVTDLWYNCCEHRQRFSRFMTDTESVRLPQGGNLGLASVLSPIDFGKKKSFSPPLPPQVLDGPLLQCNLMENLKHRQHKGGGRKVIQELPGSTLAAVSPFGPTVRCGGDEAVALKKYSGGTKMGLKDVGLATEEAGSCIDLGPHNRATSQGKPYAVYELSCGSLVAPLTVADALRSCACQQSISAAQRRLATATFL